MCLLHLTGLCSPAVCVAQAVQSQYSHSTVTVQSRSPSLAPQWAAASAAGRPLHYFVFGDRELAAAITALADRVEVCAFATYPPLRGAGERS